MKKLLALCLLATPLISFAELPGSASQTVTKNPFIADDLIKSLSEN